MIDVAIGLVLLYAVLSLFVTTVQEVFVNSHLRWRSRHMRLTVQSALGNDAELTERFFQHPLIVSLADGDGSRKPSYIPDELFAKVVLSLLGQGVHPGDKGLTPESFLAALTQARANGADRSSVGPAGYVDALKLATRDSTADWPAFEEALAHWFHQVGERSRGWFKRSSQRWAFALSLAAAVLVNADSVLIARTLWSDGELRDQLVAAGRLVNELQRPAEAASGAARTPVLNPERPTREQRIARIREGLDDLHERMSDAGYVYDEDLARYTCQRATPSEAVGAVVGNRCAAPQEAMPAASAAGTGVQGKAPARAAAPLRKSPLYPAVEWPDDLKSVRATIARAQDTLVAQAQGPESARTAESDLKERLRDAARRLRAVSHEMVDARQTLAKSKAATLLSVLNLRVREVEQEINTTLEEFSSTGERARLECLLQFPTDGAGRVRCEARRGDAAMFRLPLGYEAATVARQVPMAELKACTERPGGCEWSGLDAAFRAAQGGAWVGWLITATALSLGAPFWFDLLSKLIKLRGSGVPAGASEEKTAADANQRAAKRDPAAAPGTEPAVRTAAGGTSDVASDLESRLSSEQIRELQRKLMVTPTAVFDEATRQAIAARRQVLGLPAGATLDEALYERILDRSTQSLMPRPVISPTSAAAVPEAADLRQRLASLLGVPARAQGSGTAPDAPLTAMIRLYQGRAGLAPDGVAGPATWRQLDAGPGPAVAPDAWMRLAIAELGVDETDPADAQSILTRFIQPISPGVTSPITTAWCGYFVSFVLKQWQPAVQLPGTPERAKNWIGWGRAVADDVYGAVTVLESVGQRGQVQHHVAFMVGRTPAGWVVLGGNQGQGGKVSVTLFPDDSYRVVHRCWP